MSTHVDLLVAFKMSTLFMAGWVEYLTKTRSLSCAIIIIIASTIFLYKPKKGQKYVDIPIVGVQNRKDLPLKREDFRIHAKSILLEGYTKVYRSSSY